MADNERKEERTGGKGRLLALLALIGAGVAVLAFWRRRRGFQETEGVSPRPPDIGDDEDEEEY